MNLLYRFYPEAEIDDFAFVDGTIPFYLMIKSLYDEGAKPRVLDFGAGRGAWVSRDRSRTRRAARDLRIGASEVVAADIDDAVLENACSHKQVKVDAERPLPFVDGSFDIIVADYVFEHITNPEFTAKELLRVLKPGGWICARTANKYGYVALIARLTPNALHKRALHIVQPEKRDIDTFATAYRLNSLGALRRHFPNKRIVSATTSAEPSYHFNNSWIYRFFVLLHKVLPRFLCPGLVVFIQK